MTILHFLIHEWYLAPLCAPLYFRLCVSFSRSVAPPPDRRSNRTGPHSTRRPCGITRRCCASTRRTRRGTKSPQQKTYKAPTTPLRPLQLGCHHGSRPRAVKRNSKARNQEARTSTSISSRRDPKRSRSTSRSYVACRFNQKRSDVPKKRARRNAVSADIERRPSTISLMRRRGT